MTRSDLILLTASSTVQLADLVTMPSAEFMFDLTQRVTVE
jgi:hypothetical protein